MPAATRHRFSVVEYHRMVEAGILKPDARVELLDRSANRDLTGAGSKSVRRAGDQVRPQSFPDVAVDVAELLRE